MPGLLLLHFWVELVACLVNMKFFFILLLLISCSREIVQKENKVFVTTNKYENFSPLEFADIIGNLQCDYHHLSFEIIKGNSDNLTQADKINQEISYIFKLVQDKYINREEPDSLSFSLFQEKLRIIYDSCIRVLE